MSERDANLWAKAFSLTEGDEKRTQAKYIELRAMDLIEMEQKRRQDLQALNARDKYGMTPLSWAKRDGKRAVAEFLKQHGATE